MTSEDKPKGHQEEEEPAQPLNRAERRARARQKKQDENRQEHHPPTMKEMFSRKRSPFSGN